jgi:site-specific DNA-cytosine methylase
VRVLVACEYSGAVRDAFLALGHDAMSCDLLPTDIPGPHHEGDVFDIIDDGWDLMVAHPPCTYLSSSGVRWLYETPKNPKPGVLYGEERQRAQAEAVEFVANLLDAPIDRIAVENPQGMLSSLFRKPDQYVEPWQFGHGETKKTGLWLKNLPPLLATDVVEGREGRIWKMSPGEDRWKLRSETYPGIARAMAEQWGGPVAAIYTDGCMNYHAPNEGFCMFCTDDEAVA